MFEGFSEERIDTEGANLFVRKGGEADAPPLVLLHGYPQTSAMWHAVAPKFAQDYQVICPDLRGYGRSDKPQSDSSHAAYSKRAMASDIACLMDKLGHKQYFVCAHDRGARVAHRLGLDFPENLRAMTLLDIAPTREMYAETGEKFARAYWHWFFLIQQFPVPEQMILADPVAFWKMKCMHAESGEFPFADPALQEYLTSFSDPKSVHASCEDYRAAASIDIDHDNADAGRKLSMPIQVLWGRRGVIESCFDALDLWQQRATNVEGCAVESGHYIAEEIPDELVSHVTDFFARSA